MAKVSSLEKLFGSFRADMAESAGVKVRRIVVNDECLNKFPNKYFVVRIAGEGDTFYHKYIPRVHFDFRSVPEGKTRVAVINW